MFLTDIYNFSILINAEREKSYVAEFFPSFFFFSEQNVSIHEVSQPR
jgi:hypothetical protein